MNELKVWNFNNSEIRTVMVQDEPWFVGKDVAEVLGYSKARNAIATHVDEDDALKQGIIDSMGRTQETVLINESGLYSLILSSKLPTAKAFKHWVTSEVLPSIRKHGLYAMDELLTNPDLAIAALTELKQEREKNKALTQTVSIQTQQIAELQPKASYYDVVLNCKDLISISKIAKDYGWSAVKMNNYLHEKGVQYKQGKTWLLYQKHASYGYTSTKTHTYLGSDGNTHASDPCMYWTQKGRLFLYGLLKADGHLPLVERA